MIETSCTDYIGACPHFDFGIVKTLRGRTLIRQIVFVVYRGSPSPEFSRRFTGMLAARKFVPPALRPAGKTSHSIQDGWSRVIG